MIEIQNEDLWGRIVAEEVAAVNGNRSLTTGETVRFVNAIAKGTARVEEQGAFMDYDAESDKLLIWSSSSNEIYEVPGDKTCQCHAFQNGHVCWHRAAKRLVTRYLLAEKLESEITFLKREGYSHIQASEFAHAASYISQVEAALTQQPIGEPISYDAGFAEA